MKPSHAALLAALHPAPQTEQPRDPQGRFAPTEPPHLTLNGGPQTPPPPEPRDAALEHNRLLVAMAQSPRQLPNLERA